MIYPVHVIHAGVYFGNSLCFSIVYHTYQEQFCVRLRVLRRIQAAFLK